MALAEPLELLLGSAEQIVFASASVTPAQLERSFSIAATDFADDVDRAIQAGEIDLSIGANFRPLSGLMTQLLYRERFVCAVRRGHPALADDCDAIDLATFLAVEHILVSPRGRPGSFVDDALEALGHRRRVVLRTPHFVSALLLAAQTDLVVTLPRALVRSVEALVPVRPVEPPIALGGFGLALVYNATRKKDPAHSWLRDCILAVAREL